VRNVAVVTSGGKTTPLSDYPLFEACAPRHEDRCVTTLSEAAARRSALLRLPLPQQLRQPGDVGSDAPPFTLVLSGARIKRSAAGGSRLTGRRAIIRREHTISDAAKIKSAQAEWMRRLTAARGLGRAFAMYPETVTAAFARASQCMTTLPANMSTVTEPLPRFDPAAVTLPE
jgi:hypothetical protein